MTIAATMRMMLDVVETLDVNTTSLAAANQTVTHNAYDLGTVASATTLSPATMVVAFQQALTGGTATIDLTSLTGTNGAVRDASGLKLQGLLLRNPSTNANQILMEPGAANGYDAFGASWQVTLQPGQQAMYYGYDATPDVGASDLGLDMTGTASQALDVIMVFG